MSSSSTGQNSSFPIFPPTANIMLSSLNKRSRTRWSSDPAADGENLDVKRSISTALVTSSPQRILMLEQAVTQATTHAEALATRQRRRRARRLSKNCHTLSKFGSSDAHFRRVQNFTTNSNQTQHRQETIARQEMHRMRQQVLALERRQTLLATLHYARRANAQQLVLEKVHSYYESFSHGYDPSHNDTSETEARLRSMMLPDVQSPSFRDLDSFLVQWHNYSRYHAEMILHCDQIQLLENEDPDVYVVHCVGRSTLRISRDTIKHFFQPLLADEEMVQRLVGKTYDFPFVSRFHFNASGRVFKMEPRAELASGLFDLVMDPFSTVRMLGASKLSDDGCLHAYSNQEAPVTLTSIVEVL